MTTEMRLAMTDDPTVVHVNREAYHAHLIPFATAEAAHKGDWRESPRICLLNGPWAFRFIEEKTQIPVGVERPEFDDADWMPIPVPSNWQREGYGLPMYVNTLPAQDPDEVGCYRRWIEVDEEQLAGCVIIHFAGVRTAFHLHVNGVLVGYSETGFLPSEFDLTAYLHLGRNLLVVTVYRRTKSLHIENFDHWRLSGIFRDVYLLFRPNVHILDYQVTSDLVNEFHDGNYAVTITVRNWGTQDCAGLAVETLLFHADGDGTPAATLTGYLPELLAGQDDSVALSAIIPGVLPWSAEEPNLYRTIITLREADGTVLESTACNTGFRHLEIRDRQLLLNGQPILMKGVNRHEWHPQLGQAITEEVTRQDLVLMKRHNINAIRTSHYANNPHLLDLCDQYGIYLLDEAAHETHWHGDWQDRPDWRALHLFRIQGLVERDKNHPSVLYWSIGNEFHDGVNTRAMYDWVRQRDPSRPVINNAHDRGGPTQLDGTAYFSIDDLLAVAENSPYPHIGIEYAHAMGNALGQLHELWQIIQSPAHPSLQGGFIWEWCDHGWQVGDRPDATFDYGLRVGKTLDGHFNIDGILPPDRSISAKLHHLQYVFQEVEAIPVDLEAGTVRIFNRGFFRNLDWLTCRWRIEANGIMISEGTLAPLNIPPREGAEITVPYTPLSCCDGGESFLTLVFETTNPSRWAPAGWEIAHEQLQVSGHQHAPAMRTIMSPTKPLTVLESEYDVTVVGQKFQLKVDKQTGIISSWNIDGQEFLHGSQGPILSLCRATIDNDNQGWGQTDKEYAESWRQAGLLTLRQIVRECRIQQLSPMTSRIDVACQQYHGKEEMLSVDYAITIDGDGRVMVGVDMRPGARLLAMRSLPRVGLALALLERYDHLTWYGRGAHENYRDRNVDAMIGLYSERVSVQHCPYLYPQAYGNRTDVRWLKVADDAGDGVQARLIPASALHQQPDMTALLPHPEDVDLAQGTYLEFTALPYADMTLEAAQLAAELQPDGAVFLHLDYAQAGIGNMPQLRLPQHEVSPQPVQFVIEMTPVQLSSVNE